MTTQFKSIAGRQSEIKHLLKALRSNKPELIAVLGRRRIGKTFLIREVFRPEIVFEFSGTKNVSFNQQLENFSYALKDTANSAVALAVPKNWFDALRQLIEVCKRFEAKKRYVLFFDEMPWIDSHKSGFLNAFENFWNSWASKQKNIVVVICGSAASWMIQKIVYNKAGLHNRITKTIRLWPFSLKETEDFLYMKKVKLNRLQILEIYMAMGGVPFYLDSIERGDRAADAVNRACFSSNGVLTGEFNVLFDSLFDDPKRYITIIKALGKYGKGLSRNEIISETGIESGGTISDQLEELIECGFIMQWSPYDKKVKDTIYKLTDEFCLFYLKFMNGNKVTGDDVWQRLAESQSWKSWSGLAFERICLKHAAAIKKTLHISTGAQETAWRFVPRNGKGAQIDLLIDWKDAINIFEMKFSTNQFIINKKYAGELQNKIDVFMSQTKTDKNIILTFLTTKGVRKNQYCDKLVDISLTIDTLFDM